MSKYLYRTPYSSDAPVWAQEGRGFYFESSEPPVADFLGIKRFKVIPGSVKYLNGDLYPLQDISPSEKYTTLLMDPSDILKEIL